MWPTDRVSCWALLSARDDSRCRAWIDQLSVAVGSEPFEPHITVVGSIPDPGSVATAIAGIASVTAPLTVELTAVTDSDEFFRCVILTVRPNSCIVGLREVVAAALRLDLDPYRPHMSLLYADLERTERKELVTGIDIELPTTLEVDRLCLVDTGSDSIRRWSLRQSWTLVRSGAAG